MADVAETIEQSGRRIGHHAWVEMRLFEILGRWSGTVAEPRTRALLAALSRHHAWHAELWHHLLPDVPHLAASDLVVPDGDTAALVATLEAVDGGDGVDGRAALAAVRETVLPRLAATYAAHRERTAPIADAPTTRVLDLVAADLERDRAAADALHADLAGDPRA